MDNLTDTASADIRAAETNFKRQMDGLPSDAARLNRAHMIASGNREADPYTEALARRMVEHDKLNRFIAEQQAAIKEIEDGDLNGYYPGRPNFKGEQLARKDAAETAIIQAMAKVTGLYSVDYMASARRQATEHFAMARQRAERQVKIAEAVERQKVAAEAEEIEAIARSIVRGDDFRIGKAGRAGHSQ